MTVVGLLLLLSGWGIVLTAIVILHSPASRIGFVLAGVAVEIVGLALVFLSHSGREDRAREERT